MVPVHGPRFGPFNRPSLRALGLQSVHLLLQLRRTSGILGGSCKLRLAPGSLCQERWGCLRTTFSMVLRLCSSFLQPLHFLLKLLDDRLCLEGRLALRLQSNCTAPSRLVHYSAGTMPGMLVFALLWAVSRPLPPRTIAYFMLLLSRRQKNIGAVPSHILRLDKLALQLRNSSLLA